jgi:hypothetical protein
MAAKFLFMQFSKIIWLVLQWKCVSLMKAEREAGSRNVVRPPEKYTHHITLWRLKEMYVMWNVRRRLSIDITAQEDLTVYFNSEIIESCVSITNLFCNDLLITKGKTLNLVVCILLRVLDQVHGFPSNATLFQYYHLQADGLKMVVRPKHVAFNLNKIVKNYWNSVALDGNSWTWKGRWLRRKW